MIERDKETFTSCLVKEKHDALKSELLHWLEALSLHCNYHRTGYLSNGKQRMSSFPL